MKKNKNKTEVSGLRYKAGAFTALAISACSLFSQWFVWFAYDRSGYGTWAALLFPTIVCLAYHIVRKDAGAEGNFSRAFLFVWAAAVPLATAAALALYTRAAFPDAYPFAAEAEYTGAAREKIAVFAGRAAFSSAYLTVFALADAAAAKITEKKKNEDKKDD